MKLAVLIVWLATVAAVIGPAVGEGNKSPDIASFLGEEPEGCSTGSVVAKKTDREIFVTNCVGRVHALWDVKKGVNPSNAPVALILSQTGEYGAVEMMGLAGDPQLGLAKAYKDAGFVVIAPDLFVNGLNYRPEHPFDTAEFYNEYPRWSAAGRMLRDNKSVLDALREIGFNPPCIAAVGHSLGGYNALFLAAFDKRIDAVVSSAGFEMMTTGVAP